MLAIYTRLSKEDDNSNSIYNQQREAKEYVKLNKIKDYKIYDEGQGFSGTKRIKERPQLEKLVNDINSGLISSVWMRKQDRLARSSHVFIIFADAIKRNNVTLYFGDKGTMDLNDPMIMFNLTIMSAVDELKPMQQSKSTKKSIRDNFKEGLTHGQTPYGYMKGENRKLIVNDDEAKTVRNIYKWSLQGIGTNKIAEKLNDADVPTRKGAKWAGNTVRGIIVNTLYKGVRRSAKNKIDYPCPAIFEASYWQTVNDNLAKNRNNSGKVVTHKYLLKGKLVCGKCGRNYNGFSRVPKAKGLAPKDHTYRCSSKRIKNLNCGNRSINIDVVEDFIWSRFFADKVLKNKIIEHLENTDTEERLNEIKNELIGFEKKLKALDTEESNADKLVVKGLLNELKYDRQIKRISKERDNLNHIISNLNAEIEPLQNLASNSQKMINELDKIKSKTSFNKKREFIDKYVDKIEIYGTLKQYALIVSFNVLNKSKEGYLLIILKPKKYFAIEMKSGIIISSIEELNGMTKKQGLEIVKQFRSL